MVVRESLMITLSNNKGLISLIIPLYRRQKNSKERLNQSKTKTP